MNQTASCRPWAVPVTVLTSLPFPEVPLLRSHVAAALSPRPRSVRPRPNAPVFGFVCRRGPSRLGVHVLVAARETDPSARSTRGCQTLRQAATRTETLPLSTSGQEAGPRPQLFGPRGETEEPSPGGGASPAPRATVPRARACPATVPRARACFRPRDAVWRFVAPSSVIAVAGNAIGLKAVWHWAALGDTALTNLSALFLFPPSCLSSPCVQVPGRRGGS